MSKYINEAGLTRFLSKIKNYFAPAEKVVELEERITTIEETGGDGAPGAVGVKIVQTTGDSETAVMSQKAVTDLAVSFKLNVNNKFKNPLLKTFDEWIVPADNCTIVETETDANAFQLQSSGDSVYAAQKILIDELESGTYILSYTKIKGDKYAAIQIRSIGRSTTNDVASQGGKLGLSYFVFDIDKDAILAQDPTTTTIEFRITYGYMDTFILSEPYLGLYSDEYNGFWHPLIDKINHSEAEIESLRQTIDVQSSAANPLYGKVIAFNGDSICEARATNGGGYATIIGTNNNMTVQNLGVSGATVMYAEGTGKHCISRTVVDMREDADYIILEGGVNDLYSDRPLGVLSDGYNKTLDDTTFYGAFENMLKQALIRFPGKKIGYIAVHKMTKYFDSDQTEDNAYHAAIKCCVKWGIPVLDLNKTVPPFGYLRENEDTVFIPNAYTEDTATAGVGDGWHPNEEGYKKYYVPKIEAWLKTL